MKQNLDSKQSVLLGRAAFTHKLVSLVVPAVGHTTTASVTPVIRNESRKRELAYTFNVSPLSIIVASRTWIESTTARENWPRHLLGSLSRVPVCH
jgi:hypothetical protein